MLTGYCPDAAGRGFTDGDPDATYYPVAGTLQKCLGIKIL